jgi:hypothetical protein
MLNLFKNRKVPVEFLVISLVGVILALLSVRNILFSNGFILLWEQLEAYSYERFVGIFFPTWNIYMQNFAMTYFAKLYFYGAFALFGQLLFIPFEKIGVLMFALPTLVGFVSSYYLNKHLSKKFIPNLEAWVIIFASAVGAFVYISNPAFILDLRNIIARAWFAVTPLLLLLLIKFFEENKIRYLVLFALILAPISGYRFDFILAPMFIVIPALYLLFDTERGKRFSRLKTIIFGYAVFAFLLVLLSLGPLLPGLGYSLAAGAQPDAETFSWDLFRRDPSITLLTTEAVAWNKSSVAAEDNYDSLFAVVTSFSLMYVLSMAFNNKPKLIYYLIPLALIAAYTFFVVDTFSLQDLFHGAPMSEYLARLFRHAKWNLIPVIMSFSAGSALSLAGLSSILKKRRMILIPVGIVIVALAAFSTWPLWTGDFNKYLTPSVIPEDYAIVNNHLSTYDNQFNVVWMPGRIGMKTIWSNTVTPYLSGAPMGAFVVYSSGAPTFDVNRDMFNYYNPIHAVLTQDSDGYEGGKWPEIFAPLGIKAIIIRNDTLWNDQQINASIINGLITKVSEHRLSEQNSVYNGKYLSLYELEHADEKITAKIPLYVTDGITTHGVLVDNNVNLSKFGLLYDSNEDVPYWLLEKSDFIIVKGDGTIPYWQKCNTTLTVPIAKFAEKDNMYYNEWTYVYNFQQISGMFRGLLIDASHLPYLGWDMDYGQHLAVTTKNKAVLTMPFRIEQDSSYSVFVRYLENQNGGLINVSIEGMRYQLDTNGSSNSFVWANLGSIEFKNGKHEMNFTSIDGLNAINFVSFSRLDDDSCKQHLSELSNKTIVYIFTDRDLNVQTESNQSSLWRSIDIIKSGDYSIWLDGAGTFSVTLDGKEYNLDAPDYIHSIALGTGSANLTIVPEKDSVLNSIWLYSDGDSGLNGLFKMDSPDVKIKNYTFIDETTRKISLDAKEPFLLSFAEGYDMMWEAKIYKDGNYVGSAASVPLYSTINGFWINETGELEITLRYTLQDWFNVGIVLSAIAFLASVVYLIWDFKFSKVKHEN